MRSAQFSACCMWRAHIVLWGCFFFAPLQMPRVSVCPFVSAFCTNEGCENEITTHDNAYMGILSGFVSQRVIFYEANHLRTSFTIYLSIKSIISYREICQNQRRQKLHTLLKKQHTSENQLIHYNPSNWFRCAASRSLTSTLCPFLTYNILMHTRKYGIQENVTTLIRSMCIGHCDSVHTKPSEQQLVECIETCNAHTTPNIRRLLCCTYIEL